MLSIDSKMFHRTEKKEKLFSLYNVMLRIRIVKWFRLCCTNVKFTICVHVVMILTAPGSQSNVDKVQWQQDNNANAFFIFDSVKNHLRTEISNNGTQFT